MSYPNAPPPYNPTVPPQGGGVGFEQYQQGSPYQQGPPPYSTNPYPPQAPYPQQQYYQPYGHPQHVYTEQPKTVYVYDDRRRRDNDATECFLWGLCAACLCCCLLDG